MAKELTLTEWELIVEQIGLAEFDRILGEHMRESKWFPTLAELRERAGLSQRAQQREDKIAAINAWNFVHSYVYKFWHPDIGRFDHAPVIPPRIDFALRFIGGLPAVRNCSLDRLPFMRDDFIKAYRDAPDAVSAQLVADDPDIVKLLTGALGRKKVS